MVFTNRLAENLHAVLKIFKNIRKSKFWQREKRADIVVYQEYGIIPWILVEVKAPQNNKTNKIK